MPANLEVTVGHRKADFTGRDHLALQGAVDHVKRLGGGRDVGAGSVCGSPTGRRSSRWLATGSRGWTRTWWT